MGLQNQLTDMSSESIPILLVSFFAKCVRYLRSLFLAILHYLGLCRFNSDDDLTVDDNLVGSGLSGMIVLAEQLSMNRVFSYPYVSSRSTEEKDGSGSDCVVCLNRLRNGDNVRRLACRHVFHKECFDGWLDHLNFNCPLCRLGLLSDERVEAKERRVTADLLTWFSSR